MNTAPHRMTNLGEVHKLLEGGYSNVPQPHDTEKYDILIRVPLIGANVLSIQAQVLCTAESIQYASILSSGASSHSQHFWHILPDRRGDSVLCLLLPTGNIPAVCTSLAPNGNYSRKLQVYGC